ncbi:D-tagatose-bisphosphate aldolase, class II, non-catalytic subunit [Rhizobium tubonense]|uniref:D-tagatose-bisphosphate aldolase, class II, non-catalytic subunit n=1 Tax=Rhizobium tubonense TaxID=484088 RepID=A0A2W4CTE7_9HYPH|nr:D-tagatose-bisphosphate aldolase, class II, non-catalytic subunit [Rhizobium tubonense]PZM15937.1 D-tagatose-bisphosphate aldolase, class II, non-catalytic subunit [Rhizobium tubonense]
MTTDALRGLAGRQSAGIKGGIASICSAHPLVIEAAMLHGKQEGGPLLIEATCNQVNQEGGYTGMTPAGFRRFVEAIAEKVGFDPQDLILGGDHLGPNPWKHLPAEEALVRAEVMIDAFTAAGFTKIHLDTSMGCAGEGTALADQVTAERAARLAKVCEASAAGSSFGAPVYIIGTEVPIPGGAMEVVEHLQVTTAQAALETVEVHRRAFSARGLEAAFERAIGVVVQPGVEFGNENVVFYNRPAARELNAALSRMPQFVFEAHSTDYQPVPALSALVEDGFRILKVGPGLTFALREALYGLDQIASFLFCIPDEQTLRAAMERLMLAEPGNWAKYYHGDERELRLQRHFSYSDRIRYYWPHPQVQSAVDRLMTVLGDDAIPETLISQYLGPLYPQVASGALSPTPHNILIASVKAVISDYAVACRS